MLLLRLILIFLICYIVYSAVKSAFTGAGTKTSQRRKFDETKEEEMVLDPQCHSYVPKSAAIAKSGVYFCSQECARRYLSS
jgi:hypothetical protein